MGVRQQHEIHRGGMRWELTVHPTGLGPTTLEEATVHEQPGVPELEHVQ